MRESIGLTLNDDPEEALERYMHMHNFLVKGNRFVKDKKISVLFIVFLMYG